MPSFVHPIIWVFILASILIAPSVLADVPSCHIQCQCDEEEGGIAMVCGDGAMTSIPREAPAGLTSLDLSSSPLNTFLNRSDFGKPLAGLQHLALSRCNISGLQKNTFWSVQGLESLDLSANRLESIDDSMFFRLARLKKLNLSANMIGKGVETALPNFLFRGLSLESVDLSSNQLTELSNKLFEMVSMTTSLFLQNNYIRILRRPTLLPLLKSLRTLDVSNNGVPLEMDERLLEDFSLDQLNLSNSQITDAAFLSRAIIRILDLSNNPIHYWTFRISPEVGKHWRVLSLRNTQLDVLSSELLSGFTGLEELDLSSNHIKVLEGKSLSSLARLRVLNLSSNALLSTISLDLPFYTPSLLVLDLAHCGLVSVEAETFISIAKLQMLDLSFNQIQVFASTFHSLLSSNASVSIGGNTLHCNCETSWLADFLLVSTVDSQKFKQALSLFVCASPAAVAGRSIFELQPEEFNCTPPVIVDISPNVTLWEGSEDVLLKCSVQSDPASSILWMSPRLDSQGIITPSADRTRTRTVAHMRIGVAGLGDEGWYECSARNRVGDAHAKTYVKINSKSPNTGAVLDKDALSLSSLSSSLSTTSTQTTPQSSPPSSPSPHSSFPPEALTTVYLETPENQASIIFSSPSTIPSETPPAKMSSPTLPSITPIVEALDWSEYEVQPDSDRENKTTDEQYEGAINKDLDSEAQVDRDIDVAPASAPTDMRTILLIVAGVVGFVALLIILAILLLILRRRRCRKTYSVPSKPTTPRTLRKSDGRSRSNKGVLGHLSGPEGAGSLLLVVPESHTLSRELHHPV